MGQDIKPDGNVAGAALVERLLTGVSAITVWGGGYVGLSTALSFARRGVRVVVVDVNSARVSQIQSGHSGLPGFEEWTGASLKELVDNQLITARVRADRDALGAEVQVVAVPTERLGLPWDGAIDDVFRLLAPSTGVCIVESTLTPGTAARLAALYPHLRLAVAPRRDWFLGADKTIDLLPRVFGGSSAEASALARPVLSLVSRHLEEASSAPIAELTKCLENGMQHLLAVYACQMSRAYANIDVNEAFRLAASHWRVGSEYFASSGTGGYCVPLSSAYLAVGADPAAELSIVEAVRSFEREHLEFVGGVLERGPQPIFFLGLTYRADVPVFALSPSLRLATMLQSSGRQILIHDPYWSKRAGLALSEIDSVGFADGLEQAETIFISAAHAMYRDARVDWLLGRLKVCRFILDDQGVWEKYATAFREAGIDYRRIGGEAWSRLCCS